MDPARGSAPMKLWSTLPRSEAHARAREAIHPRSNVSRGDLGPVVSARGGHADRIDSFERTRHTPQAGIHQAVPTS